MIESTEPAEPAASIASPLTRRSFLAIAAAAILAPSPASRADEPDFSAHTRKLRRIGIQLYTLREILPHDFDGTLAALARIGYTEVELAGYYGRTPQQFRAALDAHGLKSPSTHIPFERVRDELPKVLDEAAVLGQTYVIAPNIPSADEGSLDGYRRAADVLNAAGDRARKSGIRIGYHNHGTELHPIDGVRPYDVLIERTDPALVALEMDIFWLVQGGGDPLTYFAKHPGRFKMVHVKDMDAAGHMTDVGLGKIDWAAIFRHSGQAGIEHYFVENDEAKDPVADARVSYDYLSKLDF